MEVRVPNETLKFLTLRCLKNDPGTDITRAKEIVMWHK